MVDEVMRENRLQSNVKLALQCAGAKVLIIHGGPYMPKGEPDTIGSLNGVCFALELKTPVGRLDDIQRERLKEWHDAGARVGVPTNVKDALAMAKGVVDGWPAIARW